MYKFNMYVDRLVLMLIFYIVIKDTVYFLWMDPKVQYLYSYVNLSTKIGIPK